MKRLYLAAVTALLLTLGQVGSVMAAEPPWPSDPLSHQAIVDSEGPTGNIGVWTWDYARFVGGDGGPHFWAPGWRWEPIPVTQYDPYTGRASFDDHWPDWDHTDVRAVRGYLKSRGDLGYWVWNPYVFVGPAGGPHFWSPRWLWVPDGQTTVLYGLSEA